MRDRAEPLLKLLCLVLGLLLAARTIGALRHSHPLRRTSVPEAPTWTAPTNSPSPGGTAAAPGPGLPGRPGPGGPGGPAGTAADPRLDKIVQSELLGPVMRPPPMALLGIAGRDVFFRAPNGQSGLVREGGELGGVRIERVGTNRILVRENGQLKELMIFEGIGGESLLPQGKEGNP